MAAEVEGCESAVADCKFFGGWLGSASARPLMGTGYWVLGWRDLLGWRVGCRMATRSFCSGQLVSQHPSWGCIFQELPPWQDGLRLCRGPHIYLQHVNCRNSESASPLLDKTCHRSGISRNPVKRTDKTPKRPTQCRFPSIIQAQKQQLRVLVE